MSWGKQQDVVAAPTDDQVKIVQHITSKDAQVRGCGIGKTCELTVNSYQSAIIMEKFNSGCYHDKHTFSTNPTEGSSSKRTPGRQPQAYKQRRAENCAVCPSIDQEILGIWNLIECVPPFTHEAAQLFEGLSL